MSRYRRRGETSLPWPAILPLPTRCAGRLRPRLNPDTSESEGSVRCDQCGARFNSYHAYIGGHGELVNMGGLAAFTLGQCQCPFDHVSAL